MNDGSGKTYSHLINALGSFDAARDLTVNAVLEHLWKDLIKNVQTIPIRKLLATAELYSQFIENKFL